MNRHERRTQGKKTLVLSPDPARTKAGNYVPQALKLAENAQPGKVYMTTIAHDEWCEFLTKAGPCNCEPNVSMTEVKKT